MFQDSYNHKNIIRNVLCGLIFTVFLFVLSCGKKNSTHNYDPTTWNGTQQLRSSSEDRGEGVTVDSSNNIYVTGSTQGGFDGNSQWGPSDLVLVKYNSSGTKQWTKQLETSSNDYAYGVAVDSSGNVYAAGNTGGALDGNTNAGGSDLFVVKYNSSGVKQ